MTVTLVTGANKGLGRETARRLIKEGHTVYIGARSVERGQAAASELGGQFVQLDVTDDASVETAMGVIEEREGHLDVLVNNAGISATADVSGPVALKVFDTNAIGVIRVTQAALPLLEQVRQPGRGQRLQRPRLVLGRHQSRAAPIPLPRHHLRLEQGRRLDAHRPVRQGAARDQVQRGRARLHRYRPHSRQRGWAAGREGRRGHRAHGHHRQGRPHRHLPGGREVELPW
jgi:NAD(P)-dependent dehydrogenase (short-subunit alcohol dehydrogenase family)